MGRMRSRASSISVIDSRFTGFKASVEGGMSSDSDAGAGKMTAAWGGDFGDRWHLVASAEIFDRDGLDPGSRSFATPAAIVPNPGCHPGRAALARGAKRLRRESVAWRPDIEWPTRRSAVPARRLDGSLRALLLFRESALPAVRLAATGSRGDLRHRRAQLPTASRRWFRAPHVRDHAGRRSPTRCARGAQRYSAHLDTTRNQRVRPATRNQCRRQPVSARSGAQPVPCGGRIHVVPGTPEHRRRRFQG